MSKSKIPVSRFVRIIPSNEYFPEKKKLSRRDLRRLIVKAKKYNKNYKNNV